jgi:hypothetical protein
VLTITAGLDAMEGRVAAGLERMQAIEREAQADAQADEMTRSLELYVGELGELEERGESLSSQSPFYDLPRTRLEAVLLDLTGDLEKTQRIIAELEGLLRGAPEDRALLRQKTELGLMDARALEQRLQRMEREVREEIRLPRLVRQERARRRHEALVVVASGLRYAFLHRPHDYVALQWTLPVAWDMESPPAGTQEADLRLVAQGVFSNGLWVQVWLMRTRPTTGARARGRAAPGHRASISESGARRSCLSVCCGTGSAQSRTSVPPSPWRRRERESSVPASAWAAWIRRADGWCGA